MCKVSLEDSGGFLKVLFEYSIKLKDWFYKKIRNVYYYLFTQRPHLKKIYNSAHNLEGQERCVMKWILAYPAKTLGGSVADVRSHDLIRYFESLESKGLIILDHTQNKGGSWVGISVSFEFLQSNPDTVPQIIRKALDNRNSNLCCSTDCQQIFHRLNRLASG